MRLPPRASDAHQVTLVLLDGARPDVLAKLAEAGDLPNVSRFVLEPGGMVPATTVFPSTSGVAYLPFLTGCFPGTANVPGIRWLDVSRYGGRWFRDRAFVRSYCGVQAGLLDTDVSGAARTVFEFEGDAVAINGPLVTGVAGERNLLRGTRAIMGIWAHYTKRYEPLNSAVGDMLVRVARRRHRFVFALFPAIDGLTHCEDPRHPRVIQAYRAFDAHLARYVEACGGSSPDQHLIALVSDHGGARIAQHADLSEIMEAWGLPTLRHPAALWRRNPRLAVMVSGNAAAHVYLLPGRPRSRRYELGEIEAGAVHGIPPSFVERLAGLPGVGLVVGVEGGDVVAVSADGRALLKQGEGNTIAYLPETADVLGLGHAPRALTPNQWLAASVDGPFPDAPVQLRQIFRARRTGDLVLSAAPGFDFRDAWEVPEHRSGHGSLGCYDMRCLVAVNQPVRGPIRSVDVFPMVLRHLGHDVPAGIDGAPPARAGLAV